jgi:transcriptional regulator with PAS, ATPase and Fis domain
VLTKFIQNIMFNPDFSSLVNSLPTGIVVTDSKMNIVLINDFAKISIFQNSENHVVNNLQDVKFFNTDMQGFNMWGCMQNMVEKKKRTFQKTLIARVGNKDKLVFFSVRKYEEAKVSNLYLCTFSDISNEMDCIAHSPVSFEKEQTLLHEKIIGKDPQIKDIYRKITLAADADVNVLIQGESGTGKELVVDAIHELSARKKAPLIKINCAAYPESLLESELFGYVKGAFTGADKDKPGKFELAHGGTIFLDEIGEISLALQVKLLRVIQEKVIERIGGVRTVKVDMRIVAATNRNLRELIENKRFREDLFYRLNVFNITMPPLRNRKLDIPLLSNFFIDKFNDSTAKNVNGISRDALKLLMQYHWPGNIRELQNAIEHAFVLVQNNLIETEDLPAEITRQRFKEMEPEVDKIMDKSFYGKEQIFKNRKNRLQISRDQLLRVLEMHNYNQTQTASYLGISRVGLWKKMKKMQL